MPNSKTVLKQTVPKGREGQNIGYFTALIYTKLYETRNFACKPHTTSEWRILILFTGSAHTLVGNTSQHEVKANNSCNSFVNKQFWTHSPARQIYGHRDLLISWLFHMTLVENLSTVSICVKYINIEVLHAAMFVTLDLQTILHTRVFTICLHNESHTCRSTGSLVIAMKLKDNNIFTLQLQRYNKMHIFKDLLPYIIWGI